MRKEIIALAARLTYILLMLAAGMILGLYYRDRPAPRGVPTDDCCDCRKVRIGGACFDPPLKGKGVG